MTRTESRIRDREHPVGPRRRGSLITVVTISVLLVVVGAWALIDRTDEPASENETRLEALLDDYLGAWEENDGETLQAIVTYDFVINEYFYQLAGDRVFLTEQIHEDLEGVVTLGLRNHNIQWRTERVGDPIIAGDGPWFVSVRETWAIEMINDRSSNTHVDGVSTYVVVDDRGTLKIANHFLAGLESRADS